MNEFDAVSVAQEYATKWSVPWGRVIHGEFYDPWWMFFSTQRITLFVASDDGASVVILKRPKWTVIRFEFFPSNRNHHMIPLWAAYPFFNSVTIGWRMGFGEIYKYAWHNWYRSLSPEEKAAYKKRFPPPQNEDWQNFYEMVADIPAIPGSLGNLIMGRV